MSKQRTALKAQFKPYQVAAFESHLEDSPLAGVCFAGIVAVPPVFITWKQRRPLSQQKRIRVLV